MAANTVALGALLITITNLCDAAEAHGIVEPPSPDVLGPLIAEAKCCAIHFASTPTLEELRLAVDTAAQQDAASG